MLNLIGNINATIGRYDIAPPVSSASKKGFGETLEAVTSENDVINKLNALGATVSIASIPRNAAFNGSGFGVVTIAPNILEEMSHNQELFDRISNSIRDMFSNASETNKKRRLLGVRNTGFGMVVHPDGSITKWSSSECDVCPIELEIDRQRRRQRRLSLLN